MSISGNNKNNEDDYDDPSNWKVRCNNRLYFGIESEKILDVKIDGEQLGGEDIVL